MKFFNYRPKTLIPIHADDPNDFIEVTADNSNKVTDNFRASEFYNPKVGLKSHGISKQVVQCAQIIREHFGVPIKITSSYRTYIPKGGVSHSPHMMALALDLSFIAVQEEEDLILLQIRDDFEHKGELFQKLWNAGCRGFGVYDTFVHIDTVPVDLYPKFAAKRRSQFEGQSFAFWNKQVRLRGRKVDYSGNEPVKAPESLFEVGTGYIEGAIEDLNNNDDGVQTWQGWLVGAAFIALPLLILYFISKFLL